MRSSGTPIALVTGFEAYGGETSNPSAAIVAVLDGDHSNGHRIVGRVLPVSAESLKRNIDGLIGELDPAVVVSFGLSPGEAVFRLERVAVNIADFDIADNDGLRIQQQRLEEGGSAPFGIESRLPLRTIESSLLRAGIPARVSDSAGTFLCNATMYRILVSTGDCPAGFVHVPFLPAQVAARALKLHEGAASDRRASADIPSMSLETMVAGARIVLDHATAIANERGGVLSRTASS